MKISLVSSNEDFINFIDKRNAGIQILNRYTTLTDPKELEKFSNDFNHVDVFMFIDFQDLSKEFKEFLSSVHEGKSYFLNAGEILIIVDKDPMMSKTPDLEKNLEAISAFLEKLKYNFRIVRLESLKFQDIYKSITISDSVIDSAPKKFNKYKVMNSNEGETISPKKQDITIIPDKLRGTGSVQKQEDLQTAQSLDSTIVNVPALIEPLRIEKDFKDYIALSVTSTTVVFVTGLRYSGKTTLALKCAKELEEQNLTSCVIDLTARKDIKLLNKEINCDLSMAKGLNSELASAKQTIGLNVYKKIYTSTFLTNLLKTITNGRTVTFCEVDPEQLPLIYKSFRGNKAALVLVPNNQTMLRDSVSLANSLDIPVVPVINKSFVSDKEINPQHLKDTINSAKAVHAMDNLTELVTNLLR